MAVPSGAARIPEDGGSARRARRSAHPRRRASRHLLIGSAHCPSADQEGRSEVTRWPLIQETRERFRYPAAGLEVAGERTNGGFTSWMIRSQERTRMTW